MLKYIVVVCSSLCLCGLILFPLISHFREVAHVAALEAGLPSTTPPELLTYESASLPNALWRVHYLNGVDSPKPSITARTSRIASWSLGAIDGVPVPGDYNGDGLLDLASFRPGLSASGLSSPRNWAIYFATSAVASSMRYQVAKRSPLLLIWGTDSAIAVPADYDGDGRLDVAIFEPTAALWQLLFSSGGFNRAKAALGMSGFGETVNWGIAGDVPVPADYNGDRCADLALIRRSEKRYIWHISIRNCRGAKSAEQIEIEFGALGDHPLVGDYDGDSRFELAFYRPQSGRLRIRSWSGEISEIKLEKNARVFTADFDGDGVSDSATFLAGKVRIRNSRVSDRLREIVREQSPASTVVGNFLEKELPAAVLLREHQLGALWEN